MKDQNLGFNDFLLTFYRGRKIITTSLFTVLILAAIFTFTTDPVYEASVKLLIKDDTGMGNALFGLTAFGQKEVDINNQVEILKSRTLAENVIDNILKSEYANEFLLGHGSDEKTNAIGVLASFSRLLEIFKNATNGTAKVDEDSTEVFDEMVEDLRKRIEVNPIPYTDMIEIRVTAPSPTEAAFITNTLANSYLEKNQLESQEEVRQVKNFLEKQLAIVKDKLVRSEEELKNYKEKEKVVSLPQEIQELIQKLSEFEAFYNGALTDLNSAQERLRYIDSQLIKSRQNFNIETISMSPYLGELKKKMAEIEGARAIFVANLVNKGVYNPNSFQIKKYDEQISELKERFKNEITKLASREILDPVKLSETLVARKIEVEAEIESLKPKVNALKKIVDEYSSQLESLPDVSLKLARLERAAKVDEKIYLMMKEKYEESRITEVGQLGNVRIIDTAKPPKVPIKPKKTLNLILATIMGLGLGVGITFVLDYMDDSIRTIEELERLGLPVLGAIPVIKEIKDDVKKRQNSEKNSDQIKFNKIESRLITHSAPKSPISEAYRTVRTNIQYSKVDKTIKSIVITSPGPGEGKSTSVTNLAIAITQQGSKVLLVDSDLRRPILHSIFKLDKQNGLTNCLLGRISTDEAIKKTEIDNLFLMSCGTLPPNPSEILGSVAMKNLIAELNSLFDLVLFDSPPIIAVTDPVVLGSMVDGTVMVVKSGQTKKEAAIRGHALLKNVNSNILGILLNGIEVENMYGSYYYYYHYSYYSKDSDQPR